MSRKAAIQVENNFKGGLVTEASGLNFPENACTETQDCVFEFDGSVNRRLGYDYETGFVSKAITRNKAIVTYLWKNVTGDGDATLLVQQVGDKLYFYDAVDDTISTGALTTTVNLTAHKTSGSPAVATKECQFADGNGFLFVTHPYCEPLRIEFDSGTDTVTATEIVLEIRDFEGVDDGLDVDERSRGGFDQISGAHLYNLYNQGWNNHFLNIWDNQVPAVQGMPANTDVAFLFKDSLGRFSPGQDDHQNTPNLSVNNQMRGNSPAPKGHFILTLWNQNRRGKVGAKLAASFNTGTGFQRPSTCCFFSGRLFYAGLNYVKFNSKIYFSQIVERDEQYGQCFQQNDPTSEDAADLLSADGGVISIPEAGTVYKIFTITGGVAVFAANGVWLVTGSTGIGFTAKDFTVTKLSSVNAISSTSFVDVGGFPAWWNYEGIYLLSSDGNNPKIESLTDQRIKTYYNTIPNACKELARGFFDLKSGIVQWLFRTTDGNSETDYEYNAILNFNVLTAAFYPWTVPSSTVKLHSIFVPQGATRLGTFKYVVSIAVGATNHFTFAEANDFSYLDWSSAGINAAYTSYFISGYKLHGQGIRKFQSNYVRLYSRNDVATAYDIQGVWDFANTGSGTGRWSVKQRVTHNNSLYDNMSARRKIRGHGLALQFRVSSVAGQPFDLLGWSMLESGNDTP